MSKNVQYGIEDVIIGRPEFDDPHWFTDVHESIRDHRPSKPMVALCFECMEIPKREPRNLDDRPLRCEGCEHKHARRMRGARAAKGGF